MCYQIWEIVALLYHRTIILALFLAFVSSGYLAAVIQPDDPAFVDVMPPEFNFPTASKPNTILAVDETGELGLLIWKQGKGVAFYRLSGSSGNQGKPAFFQWPNTGEFLCIEELKAFTDIESFWRYLKCRKVISSQHSMWAKDKKMATEELLSVVRVQSKSFAEDYIMTLKHRLSSYGELAREWANRLNAMDKEESYKRFPCSKKVNPANGQQSLHTHKEAGYHDPSVNVFKNKKVQCVASNQSSVMGRESKTVVSANCVASSKDLHLKNKAKEQTDRVSPEGFKDSKLSVSCDDGNVLSVDSGGVQKKYPDHIEVLQKAKLEVVAIKEARICKNVSCLKAVEKALIVNSFKERKPVVQISHKVLSSWLQCNRQLHDVNGLRPGMFPDVGYQVELGEILMQPQLCALSIPELRGYLARCSVLRVIECQNGHSVFRELSIAPYKELAERICPQQYAGKVLDNIEAALRKVERSKEITVGDVVPYLRTCNCESVLQKPVVVPDYFQVMAVLAEMDITLWINVTGVESYSIHCIDAHGQGPLNELKALQKAGFLAHNLSLTYSAPAFFNNQKVRILLQLFYQNPALESGKNLGIAVDDLKFYQHLRKSCVDSEVIRAFEEGEWQDTSGYRYVIKQPSDEQLQIICLKIPDIKINTLNNYSRKVIFKTLSGWRKELAEAITCLQDISRGRNAEPVSAKQLLGANKADGVDNSICWQMSSGYIEQSLAILKKKMPFCLTKPLFGVSEETTQALVKNAREILKPATAL